MRPGWAFCLVLSSCTRIPGTTFFLELPTSDPPAASAVIAIQDSSGVISLDAVDLGDPKSRFSLRLEASGEQQAHALLFEETLSSLELLAGPLHQSASGTPLLPAHSFVAQWDPGQLQARWVTEPPLQPISIQTGLPAVCRLHSARLAWQALPSEPRFALAASSSIALVGLPTGELLAVDPSGVRPFPGPALGRVGYAALGAGDQLFIGTSSGTVLRARISAAGIFEPHLLHQNPSGRAYVQLAARTGTGTLELFTIDAEGTVEYFDGQSWTTAGRIGRVVGAMLSSAPGQALAFALGDPRTVYRIGHTIEPLTVEEDLVTLVRVPPLGLFATTKSGKELLWSEGRFERWSASSEFGLWVFGMVPLDQGVAVLVASGAIAQYLPGMGYCPDAYYGNALRHGGMIALERGLLMYGTLLETNEAEIGFLELSTK